MILSWETSTTGGVSLVAQVQEYDAYPPVSALKLDAPPMNRHPDREALAGYLAFGQWVSGDLVMPASPSPLLAEAIEQDSLPVRVRPREVDYVPRALPRGRRRVLVTDEIPTCESSDHCLAIVPSSLARGVFTTGQHLIIPSNAFALGADPTVRRRSLLAVAVLFAADIDADILSLTEGEQSHEESSRLGDLLQCVNLQLELS